MNFDQRTVTCGQLRAADAGKIVVLNGWVHRDRNHGALHFINLRDRYGITQVVVDDDASEELQKMAAELKMEYCIAVTGTVCRRPDNMVNPDMETGEIEVKAQKIEILSRCATLPFMIDDANAEAHTVNEDLRLKYRFLDLRSSGMQQRIALRHEFIKAIRDFLCDEGFYEIETPTLIRSTPEGARDFLVPSRKYPGKFYALPQSPQLYKQLLMVSGFDKYFQIARCYRDEDSRGDRQLEFTQLDLEMSFVKRDDILGLMERLFGYVFKRVMNYQLPEHFRRIDYFDAMNTYGCDKPDLRFECEIKDIAPIIEKSTFDAYKEVLANKGFTKAIVAPKTKGFDFTRKYMDQVAEAAKVYGAKFVPFIKVGTNNTLSGSAAKYFAGLEAELCTTLGAEEGDVIFMVAQESWKKCCASIGAIRNKLGKDLGLIRPGFAFCWIVDFPLFEYNEEEGHWEAAHHMFSMPQAKYIPTLEQNPGEVRGDLYDMVVNGYECASGSIRIHDIELQKRIFRICNFSDEEAEKKFGFLLNAFKYGPPPHGGIAPGIDRMVMIMTEQSSIREVIAFPKNSFAVSPMDDCPNDVDQKQLDELKICFKTDAPKPAATDNGSTGPTPAGN